MNSRIPLPALLFCALVVILPCLFLTAEWAASLGEAKSNPFLTAAIGGISTVIGSLILFPIGRKMTDYGYLGDRYSENTRKSAISFLGLGLLFWIAPIIGGSESYLQKFFSGSYFGFSLLCLYTSHLMGRSDNNERPS